MTLRIAHIINPVTVSPDSSLYLAQPITFESMRRARDYAPDQLDIALFTAQFPEDRPLVPIDFVPTTDLDRSVSDFGSFRQTRKLPLLKDILDRLFGATQAEYLIYTNADIGLQTHFYTRVAQMINSGYDAFTINRRTISPRYTSIKQLKEMYADDGEPHRGWDCFVFQREAYQSYNLGYACIGIPRADLILLSNLQAYSKNFFEFRHEHLTFHIGNDRSWWKKSLSDYEDHNADEAIRILTSLEQNVGPFLPDSPPATYLYFAKHKILWFFYQTVLRYIHIPARFGRPLSSIMGHLHSRK